MTNAKHERLQAGFTFPELIVSLAILGIIFVMVTINISPLPANVTQTSATDKLINNIRSQQTLAMSDALAYGIHFEEGSYTLFKGNVYIPGGPDNFIINLDEGTYIYNVTFPGNLIFSAGSGDVQNYIAGSDSLTLGSQITDKVTVIKINKYGANY